MSPEPWNCKKKVNSCLKISWRRSIENRVFDGTGCEIRHRDSCDFPSRLKFLKKEKSHHDSCDCVVLIVIEVKRATEARAFEFQYWRAGENLEGFRRIRKWKYFLLKTSWFNMLQYALVGLPCSILMFWRRLSRPMLIARSWQETILGNSYFLDQISLGQAADYWDRWAKQQWL